MMNPALRTKLVTLKGECFDVEFQGERTVAERDGVFHNFHLTDLVRDRGLLRVSVHRGGPRDIYVPSVAEYDRREDAVVLNVIRRAFDCGYINFEAPNESSSYKEFSLQPSDFDKQSLKNDAEIRTYIIHKAYWLSYRYPMQSSPTDVLYPIQFDETLDLEYLGACVADILRNIQRLRNQGLLEKVLEANARPSERLMQSYESGDSAALGIGSGTSQQLVGESDDRKFARLAIEEARKSVSESDGKPHPKVGAIVVKNGKVLSTAHRGELPANHAEYIALEKKLSDEAVAGATVYTTLEPCTTRNHPKIPCASRLVERKVARVVVGMLDPDERITGRGWRKLRSAGIVVESFPSDLVPEVEELNREFTRFCEQNNQAALAQTPRTAKILPNIKMTAIHKARLAPTGVNGQWGIQSTPYVGQDGFIIQFTNEAKSAGAGNVGAIVKAHLIYSTERGELLRIMGYWLDGAYDLPLFRVDDTHRLIVALAEGKDICAIETCRKTVALGTDEITPKVYRLPPEIQKVTVLVRLTNADTGDFLHEGKYVLGTNPFRLEPA
jgi:pyrimidine deaminase RibD-like protein